jgi:hypothetical protein
MCKSVFWKKGRFYFCPANVTLAAKRNYKKDGLTHAAFKDEDGFVLIDHFDKQYLDYTRPND